MNLNSKFFVIGMVCLVGCATSRSPTKAPGHEVPLPYSFMQDSIRLTAAGYEQNKTGHAYSSTVAVPLQSDESWFMLQINFYEPSGKDQPIEPKKWAEVIAQDGTTLALNNVLWRNGFHQENTVGGHERDELKLCFRLKNSDYPIKIVFPDGHYFMYGPKTTLPAASPSSTNPVKPQ
jgi:hypothetical protein